MANLNQPVYTAQEKASLVAQFNTLCETLSQEEAAKKIGGPSKGSLNVWAKKLAAKKAAPVVIEATPATTTPRTYKKRTPRIVNLAPVIETPVSVTLIQGSPRQVAETLRQMQGV